LTIDYDYKLTEVIAYSHSVIVASSHGNVLATIGVSTRLP